MAVTWSGHEGVETTGALVEVEDAPDARDADVAALGMALPPAVARAKDAGYLARAAALCRDGIAADPASPLVPRLRLEWHRLARLAHEYRLPLGDAVGALRAAGADVSFDDVCALAARGRIDVRFIAGTPCTLPHFIDTLRIYADEVPGLEPEPGAAAELAACRAVRDEMRAAGGAARSITVRATLSVDRAGADDDVRIWLPVAAEAPQLSRIEVLDASAGGFLAAPDAPARTMSWRRTGPATCSVTYRFRIDAPYIDLWGGRGAAPVAPRAVPCAPPCAADLAEEAPHIAFTPLVRAVAERVRAAAYDDTPLELARAAYDYVTEHISYRYQPSYIQLDAIPDSCLSSGYGDCGMMALTFIALCRCLGVPARWQSGLFAAPHGITPHDWAMFHTPETGWRWADCSFGVSARRAGDEELRRFYFGNLDPWRAVFNRAFLAPFDPAGTGMRRDPFDNQMGEATVRGRGADADRMTQTVELIALQELPWDAAEPPRLA